MLSQKSLNNRKIGASDAPVIEGTAPRNWSVNTPYKLFEEMVYKKQRPKTMAMEYGSQMEEPARQYFENKIGKMFYGDISVQHPQHEFMTATLDGLDPDKTAILEIKNTNEEVHELAKSGKISSIYFPQVQQQLEICNKLYGIKRGYFGTRHKGDHALVEFSLDEEFVSSLVIKEANFWECVLTKTPPPLHEWDYQVASDLYLKKEKEWVRLKKRMEKLKALEEQEEVVRKELISLSNDSNTQGILTKMMKITQKGNVDYKSIPELKGVNLDMYRKAPITKWMPSVIHKV